MNKKRKPQADVEQGSANLDARRDQESSETKKDRYPDDEYEALLVYVDKERKAITKHTASEEESSMQKRIWYVIALLQINFSWHNDGRYMPWKTHKVYSKDDKRVPATCNFPWWCLIELETLISYIGLETTMLQGLSEDEVARRRARVGWNELDRWVKESATNEN